MAASFSVGKIVQIINNTSYSNEHSTERTRPSSIKTLRLMDGVRGWHLRIGRSIEPIQCEACRKLFQEENQELGHRSHLLQDECSGRIQECGRF